MFLIKKINYHVLLVLFLILVIAQIIGCGMGSPNSGGVIGRIINADGDAVPRAKIVSIFDEDRAVYSELDGTFRMSDLAAGLHNIVVTHQDFGNEQLRVEVEVGKTAEVGDIRLSGNDSIKRIYDVKIESISSTTAEIEWKTSKEQICQIIYGSDYGDYSYTYKETRGATVHNALLTDLLSGSLHHFRIQYTDENNILFYSYDYSFMTGEPDKPFPPAYVQIQPLVALNSLTVIWGPPSNDKFIAGYNVYRQNKVTGKKDVTEWVKVNENILDSKTFSFTDNTAESGMFYKYSIVSVDKYGAESEKEESEMVFTSGIINNSTVLTPDDSPVKIYSDIVVAAGVNLTINAGTKLVINDFDTFVSGLDEERVEFLVYGQLTIDGNENNPVIFAPLNGSGMREHWAGINIMTDSQLVSRISHVSLFGCSGYAINVKAPGVMLNNISISYSKSGISVEGVKNNLEIKNCEFYELSDTAVNIKDCNKVTIVDSEIRDVNIGIMNTITGNDNVSANKQTIIRNTDVYANNSGIKGSFGRLSILNVLIECINGNGIVCEKVLKNDGNNIDHVTINAYSGIDIVSGSLNIKNNIIANTFNSGHIGINNQDSTSNPIYLYNDVYGFSRLYEGCQAGSIAFNVDPNFVGGNPYKYELMPSTLLNFSDEFNKEVGRYGITRY